jgi:hypothetical protein
LKVEIEKKNRAKKDIIKKMEDKILKNKTI